MLTLISYSEGFPEPSNAVGKYQQHNIALSTSTQQHNIAPSTSTQQHSRLVRRYGGSSGVATHCEYLLTSVDSERSSILKWISVIPYISHHKLISEGRLEGTGEWLFEKQEYTTWRSSSISKLLLLRGIRKSPHASFICMLLTNISII
jgi:hypothetical protein